MHKIMSREDFGQLTNWTLKQHWNSQVNFHCPKKQKNERSRTQANYVTDTHLENISSKICKKINKIRNKQCKQKLNVCKSNESKLFPKRNVSLRLLS